jgi:hypothetical protein
MQGDGAVCFLPPCCFKRFRSGIAIVIWSKFGTFIDSMRVTGTYWSRKGSADGRELKETVALFSLLEVCFC